ncbi:MAG: M28 family peptidase [Chloroflexota bacterium]|nr:M28 family peptidase [Chloroflexota bacterium]
MRRRKYLRLRYVLFNTPLLTGGLIVLALFIGVLFGPLLSPHNPYLHGRHSVEYVDGNISAPPFPPSPEHPMGTDELGRDTLSMLLYGTRNTLVAAAFITMARLALGLALGGLAGWNEGRLVDQVVMGTIQMLTALPILLMAMILIFALDIRRGLPVFIVALCAVGWGEIAQYIRAEFIRIKQEPYLDSGRAIGLNSLELAIRHVLPNVLPALIVITLLEMGAVLMILGELGFVGVYIGGGTAISVGDFSQRQYFALPEWGAMMAGSRAWARSRPWMVLFPAIAFFVSVTGFNLLGEGLRRLIDHGMFNTAVLLSWRAIVIVVLITAASVYVILTLGPAPSYRHLAQQVSEADLIRHVEFLSAPDMNGRGVGSPEAYRAAEYIIVELEGYGLDAPPGGWLKEVEVTLARPAEPPELALVDQDGGVLVAFTRLADYGESVEYHGGSGEAEAPVTLILFPPSQGSDRRSPEEMYARFKGLDLTGRIVMVITGNAPENFSTEALIRGALGVLIVSDEVTPRNQVFSEKPGFYLERPPLPVFRITPATADAILSGDGLDIEALREEIAGLDGAESAWHARALDARVRMRLRLEPPETVTAYNLMWLLDGSDANLSRELVIFSCHYDGLGRAPDGTLYPGANGNASGVAALLEIARLWQEQEFQPRRSVLFVAWAGGELPYSGAHYFHDIPTGFIHRYDIAAVVHLDRLGSETGEGLVVHQVSGQENLFDLLISSAERLDVYVTQGGATRHRYQRLFGGENGTLVVTWGDPPPAFANDTPDNINPHHLSQAAQVVNLTLITAAHEPRY